MQRCLQLAKQGLRNAAPNPSVGAVLVYQNKIISEAYTSAYGGAHAEVNCLQQINDAEILKNSTLYVSLEPCSHFGKTPPCSNLIIEKGIKKVVLACQDPNSLVAGKGIAKLKNAGIEVIENILTKEATALNKRFFTFHTKKRPYIILKWAQTPNGYFAPIDKEQFWITNKKTKALVHSWRSQEMAILVGENTIITDNPRLNTRLVAGKNPLRIIINTQQKLNEKSIVFTDGNPTILFSNFEYNIDTETNTIISITDEKNVVKQVLNYLYQHEINSLIVEGGAYTLNEFIANNLWDEARILHGVNELKQGIKAPKIEGIFTEEYKIGTDTIKLLKNAKA
ncbi:MAG: bifunctional diaminohydroxyphosphoribosylaminopyrimidine deaminase/5-amino-6-(5-phosphoribosylamino)uracil reductase RibD [Chitinophagales bacterium]|nr:bifunctional diaminohydroxyphosphoribosylaminopyrimidine deaminase/5-amino-6-(5-phosphoribosylamino)uracil reductase RibD [Chitinophagales bacterium]